MIMKGWCFWSGIRDETLICNDLCITTSKLEKSYKSTNSKPLIKWIAIKKSDGNQEIMHINEDFIGFLSSHATINAGPARVWFI